MANNKTASTEEAIAFLEEAIALEDAKLAQVAS